MKRKLSDNIAIKVMIDIKEGKLKTKAICEKYKEFNVKSHDIYNIMNKKDKYYKELGKFVE